MHLKDSQAEAQVPACGTVGKWQSLQEAGFCGRKLGHQVHALGRDIETLASYALFVSLPIHNEMSLVPPRALTIMPCLTTGLNAIETNRLRTETMTQNKPFFLIINYFWYLLQQQNANIKVHQKYLESLKISVIWSHPRIIKSKLFSAIIKTLRENKTLSGNSKLQAVFRVSGLKPWSSNSLHTKVIWGVF